MRHELRGRESLLSREITLQAQNSSSEVEEGCKESHGRRGEERLMMTTEGEEGAKSQNTQENDNSLLSIADNKELCRSCNSLYYVSREQQDGKKRTRDWTPSLVYMFISQGH